MIDKSVLLEILSTSKVARVSYSTCTSVYMVEKNMTSNKWVTIRFQIRYSIIIQVTLIDHTFFYPAILLFTAILCKGLHFTKEIIISYEILHWSKHLWWTNCYFCWIDIYTAVLFYSAMHVWCKTIFGDSSNNDFAFRVILDLRRCARNLSLPYKKEDFLSSAY